jgi:dUTPase
MSDYKYELSIYINNQLDNEFISRYREKVVEHNRKIEVNSSPDSGFDLFMPYNGEYYLTTKSDGTIDGARFLGLGLKCCMHKRGGSCGFYLYPRSSISKTRMRLANSVGIIDAGYRGELISAVDTTGVYGSHDIHHIWKETLWSIKKYDRYFQICTPNLSPFTVRIVDSDEDLGKTERGSEGFGSTGA